MPAHSSGDINKKKKSEETSRYMGGHMPLANTRRQWLAAMAIVFGIVGAGPVVSSTSVVAAEPVKIGFSMALSGAYAGNGKAALLAVQMWAEDQNRKGGLLSRPIELIYYDDQSNPSLVPGIYTKLFDIDKVDFVISGYGTNIIAPAMPLVMQHKKVFMSLAGMEVNNIFHYDKYFQIYPFGPDARLAFSEGFFDVAAKMNPKPKTVAISVADSEFPQTAAIGARHWAKKYGLKIVYDKSFPANMVDFTPILRAIQATKPDVVYITCFPPNTVGIVRGVREIGFKPMLIGGGMVGPQFASVKQQLGPLLNGFVNYESYVPGTTTSFTGIQEFLVRYKPRAIAAGVDVLGYYLPPFSYAGMQVLAAAVEATKSFDQDKIADYISRNAHQTVVGEIKFGPDGEWVQSRIFQVQYQNVKGNDLAQFEKPETQVILYPAAYASGQTRYPLSPP